MADVITVGLDFGTHQTKICVQRKPDEGMGRPIYEFLTFKDLKGEKHYAIPSVIQRNDDDTLSYGFVDEELIKKTDGDTILYELPKPMEYNVSALELYEQYGTSEDKKESLDVLDTMITARKAQLQNRYEHKLRQAKEHNAEVYGLKYRHLYRYFKQATFSERTWDKDIDPDILSIWYLAYLIFKLEDLYGQDFAIQMGIPTDDNDLRLKKWKAVRILMSAYRLVEEVFENDLSAFLSTRITDLLGKTVYVEYSEEKKDEYFIKVFPEAYAGLMPLTTRGKLTDGMSLTIDIGGGTTDISFFTINNNEPLIYKYWSIPKGLNYLTENSGIKDTRKLEEKDIDENLLLSFKQDIINHVGMLTTKLYRLFSASSLYKAKLTNALTDRVVIYAGGGSTFDFLLSSVGTFTDVKDIDPEYWHEEKIVNPETVLKMCPILNTAYGLSIEAETDDIQLKSLESIFDTEAFHEHTNKTLNYIDKDMV